MPIFAITRLPVSEQTSASPGIRQGLTLLLIAGCLTPLIFLVEGILPSRENSVLDDLPQLAVTVGIVGLALAGAGRMLYSALAASPRPRLATGRSRAVRHPSPPAALEAGNVPPVHASAPTSRRTPAGGS